MKAVRATPEMAGAETRSVEMVPAIVMLIVVSADNEFASIVRSIPSVIGTVIWSSIGSRYVSSRYVATGAPREKQANSCSAEREHSFRRLHVGGKRSFLTSEQSLIHPKVGLTVELLFLFGGKFIVAGTYRITTD